MGLRHAPRTTAHIAATVLLLAAATFVAVRHEQPDPRPDASARFVAASAVRAAIDADIAHDIRSWDRAVRAAEDAERARQANRRRAARSAPTAKQSGKGRHRGYGSWQECTAMVENGGDYGRSSNRSHFGRYQFSRSTWVLFGGDPGEWGHASPADQDRVFANAVAQGASGHWTPYNGCG